MEFLTLSALPAGMLFALVTSVTPGPNNTMLLASGVNFGFRRTMPHLFGISIGVAILMLCVGFGLGEAFKRLPLVPDKRGLMGASTGESLQNGRTYMQVITPRTVGLNLSASF